MRFDFSQAHVSCRYMLFGPPGIGKSTMIKLLRRAGFSAVDLEDIPPAQWEQVLTTTDAQFIGAAGVHPSHPLPKGIYKVLLWTKQKRYDIRRAGRDKNEPCKATQRRHTIAEWKGFCWDLKVNNGYGDYDRWETMVLKFLDSIQSFEDKL